MNVIINRFLFKATQPIIYRKLEEFKVKNCHLTGYFSGKVEVPPFTRLKVYHHRFLWNEGPQLSNLKNKKPLDAKILKELSECEIITLKNIDSAMRSHAHRLIPIYKNYHHRKMISFKDIKIFMIAIELSSIEGLNYPFFDTYYISEEQNIENISKAIIEKIRSLLI